MKILNKLIEKYPAGISLLCRLIPRTILRKYKGKRRGEDIKEWSHDVWKLIISDTHKELSSGDHGPFAYNFKVNAILRTHQEGFHEQFTPLAKLSSEKVFDLSKAQ